MTEDIAHEERRGIDRPVIVLFFPFFYHDGRNAVGYYVPSAPGRNSISDHRHTRAQDANQMLFTPCTQKELEVYGLIAYENRSNTQNRCETSGEYDAQPWIQSVGVKGGRWIDAATVEEWEEFRDAFSIAADVWQKRLEITGLKDLL